jgi:uncharacterized membrane protein YbhN (UPF0104 family)
MHIRCDTHVQRRGQASRGRAGAKVVASLIGVLVVGGGVGYALTGGGQAATFARGLSLLGTADRRWLWLAGAGFGVSLVATAEAWRSAINSCGGRVRHVDASARYGVGSIVNTFLPARLGDAVRVGLFAKALPERRRGRVLTTAGALGAVTVVEALTQAPVVGAAACLRVVPLWSVLALTGVVGGATAVAVAGQRRARNRRVEQLLGVFRSLLASPRHSAQLVAWSAAATGSRLLAAAAIASALGVAHPLQAAVVMTAVLSLATAVPVTPGNVGVTSAAIVLALHMRGVPTVSAIAAGVAFHAVEAAVGIAFGLGGAVVLARVSSPAARFVPLRLAAAAAALLLAAGVATATLPQLT